MTMKTVDEVVDADNPNVGMKSEAEEEETTSKADDDDQLEVVSCSDKELQLLDDDTGGSAPTEAERRSADDEGERSRSPASNPPSANRNGRDPPVFSSVFASGNLANNLEVFKCSECPYETYNMATLTSHQKIHKLYQCDICQMKFSHAANMRRHRMRHTGFKPFECRVCLKRFFRKDHLMEHMITHSKQLPFQCPMCDKSFNRQVYFKAHLQTDHWNLPSDKICSICGHKAATIKGAKLHYTTRHAKAANTVNSSSPANSRSLAGEIVPITRSSLMSARLERGPTMVTREHGSPRSDGESFSSFNLPSSPIDSSQGSVSSSQLIFPPPLITDSLSNFVMPLTVNSMQDGGGDGSSGGGNLMTMDGYAEGEATTLRSRLSRSRILNPTRSSRLLSSSITLHRIASGRYSLGNREARSGGDHPEAVIIKSEPPDETALDNNSCSEEASEEERSILPDHARERSDTTPPPRYDSASALLPMASSSHSHSETCSPNSTLDMVRGPIHSPSTGSANATAAVAFASASALHRQVSVGDVTITPLGGALVCVHCGIVFPDQTLYFLHKGVHSENNPWKCNICGEPCRDKYDFNTHILSKAHQ